MTEEEKLAEEWLDVRYLKSMGVRNPCKKAYLAGYKAGIGRLRYCCTCKHYYSCLNEEETTMYGICVDWEIKE